jgi:hypothetical protein
LAYIAFLTVQTAIQNHFAYTKMKKILEKLGIKVLDVLSEPMGSYLSHLYRLLKNKDFDDIFGDLAWFMRIVHVLDLGAGMLCCIVLGDLRFNFIFPFHRNFGFRDHSELHSPVAY